MLSARVGKPGRYGQCPAFPVGSWGQLKAATGDGVLEHRMWPLGARHHNGLIHGFQHGQIIGGVAKSKHRNIGLLQMLFEHLHRAALMLPPLSKWLMRLPCTTSS